RNEAPAAAGTACRRTNLDAEQQRCRKEVSMLPQLNPDPQVTVDVQQTAFSHDVLGRWCCASWSEVSYNGGDPFDVVVIGAGMFGGYIAEKLYRHANNIGLRVLVVEAGDFLLPTQCRTCRGSGSGLQPSRSSRSMRRIRERRTWSGGIPGAATRNFRDW